MTTGFANKTIGALVNRIAKAPQFFHNFYI